MKALLLTLLLTYSCTKYAEVSRDAINLEIKPVKMDISHLNEIEWRVGMNKEEKVSQSFTFIVDLPKIKEEDLEFLSKRRGIDSWILRLIVARGSRSQDLGSLYALFQPKKLGRVSHYGGGSSSVTIKVSYAAAYASERFRSFKCPPFNHDKKIESMEILGDNEEFSLMITNPTSYNEKSHMVELTPSTFNAGHSLVGKYYVEIAPYESSKKLIHADFKRIPLYVSVNQEESVKIKSCAGIHPELE